jgi:hypothetical protein
MGDQITISKEDYNKLRDAQESAGESGLLVTPYPDTATSTCAMLGGGYQLGNVMIPQLTPSTMALLDVAGITSVSDPDDEDDNTMRDIVVTIYIIACGVNGAGMLMGVQRRLESLRRLEKLAEKSPEMFQRYMDKIDDIGGSAFAELEDAAMRFMDSIEGFTYTAAFEIIQQMFADVETPLRQLPPASGDKKK